MSSSEQAAENVKPSLLQAIFHGRTLFSLVMFSIFAVMVGLAYTYKWPANFLPFVIGIPGMVFSLAQAIADMRDFMLAKGKVDPRTDFEKYMDEVTAQTGGKLDLEIAGEQVETVSLDAAGEARSRAMREILLFGYFFFLLGTVLAFGFWIAVPVFMFLFLKCYAKETWLISFAVTAGLWLALYFVLVVLLQQVLFEGHLTQYFLDTYFND